MKQDSGLSFFTYLRSGEVRLELFSTPVLFLITYLLTLWIYPYPNIYADTGAYISVAETGLIGNFRPPGYSWFLAFAHNLSLNPDLLVLLQSLLYFSSTLFLYLTARYFFRQGNKRAWKIFFFVFLLAPVCIYLTNFAISDSLFISLTNLWVASLLWIIGTRKWISVICNSVLLILLIQVRYIALFYPLLTVIALFLAFFKNNKLRFFFSWQHCR